MFDQNKHILFTSRFTLILDGTLEPRQKKSSLPIGISKF